ncbi:hypothetical protein K1T71_000087 [Dendrolimus kikuchii]|uniref:Uncharacterized protein n=1 Tax=Dendrolimus kikuchii TaxID=765133 RepID=A0ACC1DI72_9NEOP|nr:hypothetical protein K1T71_000087 [Dendrolimus kikuchii]
MLSFLVMIMSLMSTGYTINRPVYKVVLTQKGYAQFIQYDVDTPPLREFTFCTWIRVYELVNDQTIFSYIAQGNNRVIRLWLDSGGHHIKLSINGREATGTHVDIVRDVWKHVCLSYQSDFGAWALYIDARLVSCEASQSLHGYVLPGSGSVIIGYGTANTGAPNGLEGEIFGANMILKSTIERNVTIRNDPMKRQRHFFKNKLKDYKKSVDYIVLSNLHTEEVHNNFEMSPRIPISNFSQNYIRFSTPNSFIVHKIGSNLADNAQKKLKSHDTTIARDILDFTANDKELTTFWNVLHKEEPTKFSSPLIEKTTISSLGSALVPKISEFETPPPPTASNKNVFVKSSEVKKPAVFQSLYKISEDLGDKTQFGKKGTDEISEVETPPPPDKSNKVYGQWTSSKFANSVLNYLKSINFHKKEHKKVPATIPLTKVLDNFPYASEFKLTKIRPPLQFRRSLIEKRFDSSRDPQINVQILEDDLRSSISKSHAKTKVKNVEITSRGDSKKNDHRKYRQVNTHQFLDSKNSSEDDLTPKSFSLRDETQKYSPKATLEHSNLLSILPFLKSLEYFVDDSQNTESMTVVNSDDMYSKSLSNRNKWHNVKTYSNDYTPRHINMDSENEHNELKRQIAIENNKSHPSIRLKYKPESRKIVKTEDPVIIKGRELAQEISNQSNSNQESISIIKYNHGYLPGHNKKIKMDDKFNSIINGNTKIISQSGNNFDKQVKLGNALNERHVIGNTEEQKKQSFVGGDESIPDINKYRSDIDNESIAAVPPSLGPRICKDIELYERVLYVKPDESIDITNILSPVKLKNVGIEFITQNYKKCSLADSSLEENQMLFIDWSKTPVRLFGGAYAKTTTDLCGFF